MILIETNTTKAKIFDLLLKYGALKSHQIFEKINSQRTQKITGQGTHKLLKQMVREKILVKSPQKIYAICPSYRNKIKQELRIWH